MYENAYTDGGFMAFGAFLWIFFAAFYLFFAYAQYCIAKKCSHETQAWWGFIPILNVFLLLKCAGREWYWFLFLLVPIVNIVAAVILWVDIAKAVGKHPIWGVLTLIPFINFVAVGVLAFSALPPRYTPPRTPAPHQPVGV